MEDTISQETSAQTIGEVVQLGTTAFKRNDIGCDGKPWVNIGDMVHFNRYGAVRINHKESEDIEYWVIMDKDLMCIEIEDNKLNKIEA
jgi:co-chaperonin GroES (HSP10)